MPEAVTPPAAPAPVVPPVVVEVPKFVTAPPAPAAAAPVAPAAPIVEAKPDALTPEAKKEEETRSRLALQAAQNLKDKAALKKQQDAVAATQKEVDTKKKELDALAKEKDAVKLLKAAGMSDADIAAALLNGGKVDAPPEDPALAALKSELAELKTIAKSLTDARDTAATAEAARELAAAKQGVLADIASKADAYPWINSLNQGDMVIARIQKEHAGKKPEDVPETAVEDAAKAVEADLAAAAPAYWKKALAVPAVRALVEATLKDLGAVAAAPTTAAAPAPAAVAAPVVTPAAKVETAKIAEAETKLKARPPQKYEVKTRAAEVKLEPAPLSPSERWAAFKKERGL